MTKSTTRVDRSNTGSPNPAQGTRLSLPLSQSKAYVVFLEEVARAAEQVRSVLEHGIGQEMQGREALARTFHTTKGGAGFLGLTQVAEAASELEEMLNRPAPLPAPEELEGLVHRFEEALSKLPRREEPSNG